MSQREVERRPRHAGGPQGKKATNHKEKGVIGGFLPGSARIGKTPMERLLADNTAQQSSLVWRQDAVMLSIWRDCRCDDVEKL